MSNACFQLKVLIIQRQLWHRKDNSQIYLVVIITLLIRRVSLLNCACLNQTFLSHITCGGIWMSALSVELVFQYFTKKYIHNWVPVFRSIMMNHIRFVFSSLRLFCKTALHQSHNYKKIYTLNIFPVNKKRMSMIEKSWTLMFRVELFNAWEGGIYSTDWNTLSNRVHL